MNKLFKNKNWQILLIILALLVFESCRNGGRGEFNRVADVFFISVLQIINIVIFGTMTLLFCVLGQQKNNKALTILGLVFLVLFTLITLASFQDIISKGAHNVVVYAIFFMEFAITVIGFIFAIKPRDVKGTKSADEKAKISDLDEIINEEEEII